MPIRIHTLLIATPQGKRRDEPQHIAHTRQVGELPVGAVAAAAHGPGGEGAPGEKQSEDDRGETSATRERTVAKSGHSRSREGKEGEPSAATERISANIKYR